ncbi:MAG: TlyA family RNA methyltransferase [Clostridia bacterium]|nr:TlyA family RNA methyltransferase [Clostridia bacterium]
MRIDKYLAEEFGSRAKAAFAIKRGIVLANGKAVTASYVVKDGDVIEVLPTDENFVSAGGFKLNKALTDFKFPVDGKIFVDIGASTGGFTDCLLQNGAKKVYCIDVGESQLDKSLKDKNVVLIDNFNARNLNQQLFSEELDGVVIDVSFISLTYILSGVSNILNDGKSVIALIKPQFECEGGRVGKNGIVKDRKVHESVIRKIYNYAVQCGLLPQKLTVAPIVAGKNKEYLILLEKGATKSVEIEYLLKSVK